MCSYAENAADFFGVLQCTTSTIQATVSVLWHSPAKMINPIQIEASSSAESMRTSSEFDASFDAMWWTFETQTLVATHVVRNASSGLGSVKDVARLLFEAKEVSIDIREKFGLWDRSKVIDVTLPDTSTGTKLSVIRPTSTKVDGLMYVAHFARNMEALKISYEASQENWVLPIFADAGHWTNSLIQLEVVCGSSGGYHTDSFQGKGLRSYPKRLRHFAAGARCHRVSYEDRSLVAFLKHIPCLETLAVVGESFFCSINTLSTTAHNLRVLKLLPNSDYHDFGYFRGCDKDAIYLCKFKTLQQLDMQQCNEKHGEDLLHILAFLPETSIVSFLVGPTPLTEAGADILCSYLSRSDCRLQELTFKGNNKMTLATQQQLLKAASLPPLMSSKSSVSSKLVTDRSPMDDFERDLNIRLGIKASLHIYQSFLVDCSPRHFPTILASTNEGLPYAHKDWRVSATTIFLLLRERPDMVEMMRGLDA